jgi:hypothetical protein
MENRKMKTLTLLILLILAFTAGAQTAQQDSAHRAYHLMRKKDPKQNNPYAFADSARAKKHVGKSKKKTK